MAATLERYDISLDLSGDGKEYPGEVKISCNDDFDNIELDAKDMIIESVLVGGNAREFTHDTGKWKIKIHGKIERSSQIIIHFKGSISSGVHGLHSSGKGEDEIISSDLAPNAAREMFPCLDDPSMKAVFSLSVKIKSGKEAISNMPVMKEVISGEIKVIKFLDTPRMATYLLFLGVGRFATRSKKYRDVDVILAAPGKELRSDDFPLNIAIKCLEFYENYFEIKYPLPKLHLVAIPELAWGAMENWGAITFRETSLLTNQSTDASLKIWIETTIAHEIAHQWFGDLVTMKWWNDLWLNESFATFMSYLCTDSINPEEEIWKVMYQSETLWAIGEDALKGSHPIDVKVHSPYEIQQIFDGISYGKGGSVLRMVERYVGRENFRSGVSQYLKDFAYSNVEGIDLWRHIEAVSKLPVVNIAEKWVGKQGFPFISATETGGKMKLRQERFHLDGTLTEDLWPIPVTIKRSTGEEKFLMDKKELEISAENFIKINDEGTGFFISKYEDEFYKTINQRSDHFTDIDLSEIANDTYMLLLRGDLTLESYLTTIESISGSPVTPVVNIIAEQMEVLQFILPDNPELAQREIALLHKIDKSLGPKREGEKKIVTSARNSVRELLAKMDLEFARSISGKFENFFNVDPEERMAVSIAHSRFSDNFDEYLELFRLASTDHDRHKLINGLARLKGKKNHERLFEMILNGEIKKQDLVTAIGYLIDNRETKRFLLGMFVSLVKTVREFFEGTYHATYFVQNAIPKLGLDNIEPMKKLLEQVDTPDVSRGIANGLETLEIYQRLRDKWK